MLQFYTKEETEQKLRLHDSLWSEAIKQSTSNSDSKINKVRDDISYGAHVVVSMTIACSHMTSFREMKKSTNDQRSPNSKQKFPNCRKTNSKSQVIPLPHKMPLPNNQCWVAGRVESLTGSHEEIQSLVALEKSEWRVGVAKHSAQMGQLTL